MPSHHEKQVHGVENLCLARTRQMLSTNWFRGRFRYLEGDVGENERLKRDKAKLRAAYDTNIEALSRHQTEFERQKFDFEKQLSTQKTQNDAILKAKQAVNESVKKRQAGLTALQEKLEIQSLSAKQLMNEIKKRESTINVLEATNAFQKEILSKAVKGLATFQSE